MGRSGPVAGRAPRRGPGPIDMGKPLGTIKFPWDSQVPWRSGLPGSRDQTDGGTIGSLGAVSSIGASSVSPGSAVRSGSLAGVGSFHLLLDVVERGVQCLVDLHVLVMGVQFDVYNGPVLVRFHVQDAGVVAVA